MKFNDINDLTSVSESVKKAGEFANAFLGVTPFTDARCECTPGKSTVAVHTLADAAAEVVKRLARPARAAFLFHLGAKFGGARIYKPVLPAAAAGSAIGRVVGGNGKGLLQGVAVKAATVVARSIEAMVLKETSIESLSSVKWTEKYSRDDKGKRFKESAAPYDAAIVLPVTKTVILDGLTFTRQLLIYLDNSTEKTEGHEFDAYITAEAGGQGSVGTKGKATEVLVVNAKGGIKAAYKKSVKEGWKTGKRLAEQATKTFVVQKRVRNVITFSEDGAYLKLEHEYGVLRKDEVNEWHGPFLPDYDRAGWAVAESAAAKALTYVDSLLDQAAIELATHSLPL